jgi:hypothetical protein
MGITAQESPRYMWNPSCKEGWESESSASITGGMLLRKEISKLVEGEEIK